MGQNGHSSPQQWSEQSTDAYMGLSPPTTDVDVDNQYRNPNMNNKDHLDGQLTTMAGQTSKSQASKSTSNDKLFLACETCEYGKNAS